MALLESFPSFSDHLLAYDPSQQAPPRPAPADIPATGTGDWFTSGIMSGFHGAMSEGARALQAVAQGVGATDTAQSFSDFADAAHAREQSYARPDLEANPWSPSGIGYQIGRMVPTTLAALGGGALAAATAPEAAAGASAAAIAAAARAASMRGLAGAAATMFPFAAGANVQRQISETGELTQPGKALVLGVPEAVVQGWLPGKLEAYFGKGILQGIKYSALTQGFAGGATEWLTQQMGDPDRGFADRASDVVRQALSGAALGGIVGGAFGGMRELAGKNANTIKTGDLDKSTAQALEPPPSLPPAQPGGNIPAVLRGMADELQGADPARAQFMARTAGAIEKGQFADALQQTPDQLYRLADRAEKDGFTGTADRYRVIAGAIDRNQARQGDLAPPVLDVPPAAVPPAAALPAAAPPAAGPPAAEPPAAEPPAAASPAAAPPAAAPPAAVLPAAAPPAAVPPAAVPPAAAPPPYVIDFTKGRFKEATAEYGKATPEVQAAMRQPLVDELIAREVAGNDLTKVQEKWGKALDILDAKGKVKDELRPAEESPGLVAAPAAEPSVAPGERIDFQSAGARRIRPEEVAPAVAPAAEPPVAPGERTDFQSAGARRSGAKVAELTAALGDNAAFQPVYQSLKELPRETVVDIANKFNGPVAPSTSKSAALSRILSRHNKLLEFQSDVASPAEELPGLVRPEAAAPPVVAPVVAPVAELEGIPDFLRRVPRPVASDAPIETVDDRAATLSGVAPRIVEIARTNPEAAQEFADEAKFINGSEANAKNNPGMARVLNTRAENLRSAVAEKAQLPADAAASSASPRAEAVPAPTGDLDERMAKARRALEGLKKVLEDRSDALAAIKQHEDWLKTVNDADSPAEYQKALAANPEADPDADNLGNIRLTGLSQKTRGMVNAYLNTRYEAVLQETRALSVPEDSRARVINSRDGLPVTQLDADVTDMSQRGVKMHDALDHIAEHSADPEEAELAAWVKQGVPKNVTLAFRDGVAGKEGEYFPKQQTSVLYNAANATITTLHEAVHAALSRALEGTSAAAQAMRGIYDQLKSKGDHAGITDAHEMVAEGVANPVYRSFLKSQFVEGTSLWDRFIDAARGMIGLPPRLFNAFDRIMSHGDDLLKEQQQYPNVWLGRDSYARVADKGTGTAAAGADEGRANVTQQLKDKSLNPREGLRRFFHGLTDTDNLVWAYRDVNPAMQQWENVKKVEAPRADILKAAGSRAAQASKALPQAGYDLVNKLMTATAFGIDPRKSLPEQTAEVRENPAKVQAHSEYMNDWNQLGGVPGGRQTYEAFRAIASGDIHAKFVDGLQELERANGLHTTDAFKEFQYNQPKIHTDPLKREAFYIKEFDDRMGALSAARDTVKAQIDDVKNPPSAERLSELTKTNDSLRKGLASIKQQQVNATAAPYFHLGRDGDYFVVAKLAMQPGEEEGTTQVDQTKLAQFQNHMARVAPDVAIMLGGEHPTVYMKVKNASEAAALSRSVVEAQAKGFLDQTKDSIGRGKVTDMFQQISTDAMKRVVAAEAASRPDLTEFDAATQAKLNDAFDAHMLDFKRALLNTTPENSITRLMSQRANVQGFSKNMIQSSLYANEVMSRHLARTTNDPELGVATQNMLDRVREINHDQTIPLNTALGVSQAVSELMQRDRNQATYAPSTMLDAARHVTHTMHIGFSVPYALMLQSQVATTLYPVLAATHGYGPAASAILGAQAPTFRALRAIAKGPDKFTAGISQEALEAGGVPSGEIKLIMDSAVRGDLGAMYSPTQTEHSPLAQGRTGAAFKALNSMGIYSELAPRLTALFAADALYRDTPYKSQFVNSKADFISEMIDKSQGNWTAGFNARQFTKSGDLGQAAPFLMQFMGWRSRMSGFLYNNVRNLFTGDPQQRAEATRWLVSHAAATTFFAGTLGLPMVSVAATVYDRLADWFTNRDDHDLVANYRNFLSDTFGKDMGEIVARGLPRAAGVDFAHWGEGDIIPGSATLNIAFEKRKLEDMERDWLKSAAGPAVSDLANFASAARDMLNGDYLNGMTKVVPENLKGGLEAYRLGERGFVDNLTGQKLPIGSPSAYDIMLTALGIDPAKQAEYQEVTREAVGLRTMRELNSSNIVRHMEVAYTRGDQGMFNTWMGEAQKWQQEHPGMVPPQAGFQRELANHMRQSAQAQATGLPIGVTPRDISAQRALRYGNIGQ
jgi:hypothetical protein